MKTVSKSKVKVVRGDRKYTYYRIRIPKPGGGYRTEQYSDENDAARRYRQLRGEQLQIGVAAFALTQDERLAAAKAVGALRAAGMQQALDEVVEDWLERRSVASKPSPLLSEVVTDYIAAKTGSVAPRTLRGMVDRLRKWTGAFGSRPIGSLETVELETWARGQSLAPATVNSLYQALNALYKWAEARRIVLHNPAAAMVNLRVPRSTFRPIDVATLRRALEALQEEAPDLVAGVALRAFAGIRTSEIQDDLKADGLRAGDIDFQTGQIHVRPEVAKGGIERWVPLEPNLVSWLFSAGVPNMAPTKRIPANRTQQLAALSKHGISLDRNILRKSYASYHMRLYKSPSQTAANMGHYQNLSTTFRNYARAVRDGKEAMAYFSIVP